MKITFTGHGRRDYLYWQEADRKIPKKIKKLIADIGRDPSGGDGIGKPEILRNNLAGFRSRRITDEHRLVYAVDGDTIVVIACRYHYER